MSGAILTVGKEDLNDSIRPITRNLFIIAQTITTPDTGPRRSGTTQGR